MTTHPPLGRYEIDTENSAVEFGTRHMFGLGRVRGTFAIRNGIVEITEPLAESCLRVEIDTASFHTGNQQRDTAVRSARFLDAGRYPAMTFTAAGVDGRVLAGMLTVGQVTASLRLTVDRCEITQDGFTASATARVDRNAFGVTAMPGVAGRHLQVSVLVTCVRARLTDREEGRARARR